MVDYIGCDSKQRNLYRNWYNVWPDSVYSRNLVHSVGQNCTFVNKNISYTELSSSCYLFVDLIQIFWPIRDLKKLTQEISRRRHVYLHRICMKPSEFQYREKAKSRTTDRIGAPCSKYSNKKRPINRLKSETSQRG